METENLNRARLAKTALIKQLASYDAGISVGLSQQEENWILRVNVSEEKAYTCVPLIFLGFKVEKFLIGEVIAFQAKEMEKKTPIKIEEII